MQVEQILLGLVALIEFEAQSEILVQRIALLRRDAPLVGFFSQGKIQVTTGNRKFPAVADIGDRAKGEPATEPVVAIENRAEFTREVREAESKLRGSAMTFPRQRQNH